MMVIPVLDERKAIKRDRTMISSGDLVLSSMMEKEHFDSLVFDHTFAVRKAVPADCHERIIFETDPERGARVKRLKEDLRIVKRKLRDARRGLSKEAFARLCLLHSRKVTQKVTTRPKQYEWVKTPDIVIRNTVWDKEYMYETDFLRHIISAPNTSEYRKRKARRRLRWILSQPHYREVYESGPKEFAWRTNPRSYVVKRIKLPPHRRVKRVQKTVTLHDWDTIRLKWIVRMARTRKLRDSLHAQMNVILGELASLHWSHEPTFNRCLSHQEAMPLSYLGFSPVCPQPSPLSQRFLGPVTGTYGEPQDLVAGWDYRGGIGCVPAHERQWIGTIAAHEKVLIAIGDFESSEHVSVPGSDPQEWLNRFRSDEPFEVDPSDLFITTRQSDHRRLLPCLGYGLAFLSSSQGDEPAYELIKRAETAGMGGTSLSDIVHHSVSERATEVVYLEPDPREVRIDDQSIVHEWEDQRGTRSLALRNLNLRRDAVQFNFCRSLGELKDTKQTVESGRDFTHWLRSAAGTQYLRGRDSYGNMHTLCSRSGSNVQRRLLMEYLKPNCSSARRVAIREQLGFRSLKVRTLTARNSLKTLAAVYLAYKFAIEPTIGDVNTCIREGYHYVTAIRRGLGQMLPYIRYRGNSTVIRRYWTTMVGDPLTKPPPAKRASKDHVVPLDDAGAEYLFEDGITLSRLDYWAALSKTGYAMMMAKCRSLGLVESVSLGGRTVDVPLLETNQGLLYVHPAFQPPDDVTPEEWSKVYNAMDIWASNAETLAEKEDIPLWLRCNRIYVRQVLHGLVFARFTAPTIRKALDGKSWRNTLALTQAYKTAWELAPLSFVTEWLTNLRQCSEACNDLINMQATDLHPKGGVWESSDSRIWAGCSDSGNLRLTSAEWNVGKLVGFHVAVARDMGSGEEPTVTQLETLIVPREVTWRFGFENYATGVTLLPTPIKRYYRLPQTDKLCDLVPKPRVRVAIQKGQAGSLALILMNELL